jgi:hypothetical protein
MIRMEQHLTGKPLLFAWQALILSIGADAFDRKTPHAPATFQARLLPFPLPRET